MKILKFLISRAVLTALIVLAQMVFLLYLFVYLSELFFQIYVVFEVLSICVVFYILRKNIDPQIKLPWILLVLIIPPFGFIIYAMFHSNNPRKKHLKIARLILSQHNFDTKTPKEVKEELKKDERAYGQSSYLEKMGQSPTYKNTILKYFESGESLFESLLEELAKAKKFIFMEYFIIERGIMWDKIYKILKEKAKAGVEVLVMYDDIGSIYKLPYGFAKKNSLKNLTITKFNKFRPIVSAVHNNRDHRKITIIDGKVAFTGGVNIADEYINEKVLFGHWKDTGIMLKGAVVDSLTNEFLKLCMLNGAKFTNTQKYFPLHKEEQSQKGFVHPIFDGPQPLYKDKVGENAYINIINQAVKYVYITTPYLIIDYGFLEALKLAAKRGVDVRIITPHIPDKKIIFIQTRSHYKQLLQAGIKIYEYLPGFMHAKTLVSDDKFAIVGTFNLDYRSFMHHFENGIWIFDNPVIAHIKKDVEDTIDVSKNIQVGNYKFGLFSRLISDLLAIFSSLM